MAKITEVVIASHNPSKKISQPMVWETLVYDDMSLITNVIN